MEHTIITLSQTLKFNDIAYKGYAFVDKFGHCIIITYGENKRDLMIKYLTEDVKFICDNSRHLVCYPYSIENLHKMAEALNIKRHWFHKNHYDIPKRRIVEIQSKCEIVTSKELYNIIT